MRITWIVALTLVGILIGSEEAVPTDVCEAVKLTHSRPQKVRGLGVTGEGDDSLVMVDYTCPVARSGAERVPAGIRVDVVSFASKEVRARFQTLRPGQYLQLLVEGDLSCKAGLKIDISGTGDMLGNGYGTWGILKCKMDRANLVDFVALPRLFGPRPTAPPPKE